MGIINQKLRKQSDNILEILKYKPEVFGIEFTTRCPLSCTYCNRSSISDKETEMEPSVLSNILKTKIRARSLVLCGLGEPAYHTCFDEILELIPSKSMLITSGTLRLDFNKLTYQKKISIIAFSVDSCNPNIQKTICRGYNWENLLANLKEVRKTQIFTIFNITINKKNFHSLRDLILFGQRNGIQCASLNYPIPYDNEDTFMQDYINEIQLLIYEIKKEPIKGILIDYPDRIKCFSGKTVVPYIDIHQNVYPCCICMNKDYSVGNLTKQSFDKIWLGKPYQFFRTGQFCKDHCLYYKIFNKKEVSQQ